MNSATQTDLVGALWSVDALEPGCLYIAEDLLKICDLEARRSFDLEYDPHETSRKSNQLRDLLLLLQLSLFDGNLCISSRPDDTLNFLSGLGVPTSTGTPIARFLADLVANGYLEMHLKPLFDDGILVRKTYGSVSYLYPGRQWRAIECIRSFALQSPARSAAYTNDRLRQWFHDVLIERPIMGGAKPIAFTAQQRLALLLGLTEPFFILSGGPGTGKTTIILNLLRLMIRSGIPTERIRMAAPTGKAAARMMESINAGLRSIKKATDADRTIEKLKSSTLHGLLGIRPGIARPVYNTDNPIDADVVVVDEVSMVDAVMMSSLLSAIAPQKTRLILLGDRDQLPSVESGAVLADLLALLSEQGEAAYTEEVLQKAADVIGPDEAWRMARRKPSGPNRYVHLTYSHRSERAVRDLAAWVNSGGEGPSLLKAVAYDKSRDEGPSTLKAVAGNSTLEVGQEGTFLFSRPDRAGIAHIESLIRNWGESVFPSEWEDMLDKLAHRDAPTGRTITDPETTELVQSLFQIFNRSRILTVLRRGPLGAESMQRMFQRYMISRGPGERRGLFSGLPVLIRRNDPFRELANGDTGLILQFRSQRFLAVFDRNPMTVFSPDVLPQWEPAYAMTVHKSQGSEYDSVLIILPDEPDHPLMNRQVLYTGITRARKSVFLYGSEDAIRHASRKTLRRITGFDEMISN